MRRTSARIAITLAALLPASARAGGFDIPDVGTEALGRGGAFVAKADSGLALYYNVAGMAQQRGTHVMLDVNLIFHDMAFTRDGTYGGNPSDAATPWAGQRFPTVHNQQGFGYQPFLAVTTDGGYFEHWTFGLGVYAPPGIGQRQYGTRRDVTVVINKNGDTAATPRYETDLPRDTGSSWSASSGMRAPAPSRYDIAETKLTILTPTLGAAYRPSKYIDVGAAIQWVVGEFELMNANLSSFGASSCIGSREYPGCDSYGQIHTTSESVGFLFSVLAHPLPWLDAGLTYRPQVDINSTGFIHPFPVISMPTQLDNIPATFGIKLPHILRGGVRAVSHYPDGSERLDLELDGTWENWSVEQAAHIQGGANVDPAHPFPLGPDGNLVINVPHKYMDTFSVRLGGAYNYRVSTRTRLTFRLGAYYDSPTTKNDDIHLDAYTTEKWGVTAGLGLKHRGFTLNLAYAGLLMPDRIVKSSSITAISSTNGTRYDMTTDQPLDVVGNGRYQSSMQMLSVGLAYSWSD